MDCRRAPRARRWALNRRSTPFTPIAGATFRLLYKGAFRGIFSASAISYMVFWLDGGRLE